MNILQNFLGKLWLNYIQKTILQQNWFKISENAKVILLKSVYYLYHYCTKYNKIPKISRNIFWEFSVNSLYFLCKMYLFILCNYWIIKFCRERERKIVYILSHLDTSKILIYWLKSKLTPAICTKKTRNAPD